MLDRRLSPVSALAGIAVPGRHGSRTGQPGLVVEELDGLQIVGLAARRGQAGALAQAIRDRFALDLPTTPRSVAGTGAAFVWSGAEQWLVIAEDGADDLAAELRGLAAGLASVTAQGDGRMVLRISGPAAREALSAVVAIDLHPRSFRTGDTALTLANHVGVQLRQVDDGPGFELIAFRSYAGSLFHAVMAAGLRFGVEVLPTRLPGPRSERC